MEDVNWKKYATKVEKEIQENISEKVMAVGMWENTIKDVLKQEAAKEIGIKKIKVGPMRLNPLETKTLILRPTFSFP